MLDVVPLKADHLFKLDLQDSQQYISQFLSQDQAEALEASEWSFTALKGGEPIACSGIIPMWQGRALAWAYLSSAAEGPTFLAVHRAVKRFLDACYIQRLEMTVDCGFEAGHRWARMLGFNLEAETMRAYRPDGGDCALYARVL